MFTKLGVENFKAWKGKHTIPLRPLTLLLGVNSAGKTSLLQPLLLLKQTAESPDRQQACNLGGQPGDTLHLGTMEDVLSGHDVSAHLSFSLTYELPTVTADDEEDPFATLGGPAPVAGYEVEYVVPTNQAAPVIQRVRHEADGKVYEVSRQKGATYALTAPSLGGVPAKRTYEPERGITFSAEAVAAMGTDGPLAQDLALALTRTLQRVSYLGPLRDYPSRVYAWNGQMPGQLGMKGELAIQALLASANGRGPEKLVTQVSRWLKEMDVADELLIEKQGRSNLYEVRVVRGKQRANLVDVGFGISQVLPVITLAYFVPRGSTIIMEQPEIHLHPLAQANLANLLVEVSQERHVQFLVETHSEHLFRRLQSLIADLTTTPDQCELFFVDRSSDEGAELKVLDMDEFGRIKNWPAKFFGDAVGEAERLARQMIRRKKAESSGG